MGVGISGFPLGKDGHDAVLGGTRSTLTRFFDFEVTKSLVAVEAVLEVILSSQPELNLPVDLAA